MERKISFVFGLVIIGFGIITSLFRIFIVSANTFVDDFNTINALLNIGGGIFVCLGANRKNKPIAIIAFIIGLLAGLMALFYNVVGIIQTRLQYRYNNTFYPIAFNVSIEIGIIAYSFLYAPIEIKISQHYIYSIFGAAFLILAVISFLMLLREGVIAERGVKSDIYKGKSLFDINCPKCHYFFKNFHIPEQALKGEIDFRQSISCPKCKNEFTLFVSKNIGTGRLDVQYT